MNLTIFFISLIIEVLTAIIGYLAHIDLVQAFILILCEMTLSVCLELLFAKTRSDKLLGDLASSLQKNPFVLTHVRTIASRSLEASSLKSPFISDCLERLLRDVEATLEGMASGTLKIDLGPGGRFYSETDAISTCNRTFRATSLVNQASYWHSRAGREALVKNRACIASGKLVTRIFIEQRSNLPKLLPIIEEHRSAGVECYIAIADDLDPTLKRDFALLDDNSVAVELILDSRTPVQARFYIAERDGSRRDIQELHHVWSSLLGYSRKVEDVMKLENPVHSVSAPTEQVP
jgi:hypothetical protein